MGRCKFFKKGKCTRFKKKDICRFDWGADTCDYFQAKEKQELIPLTIVLIICLIIVIQLAFAFVQIILRTTIICCIEEGHENSMIFKYIVTDTPEWTSCYLATFIDIGEAETFAGAVNQKNSHKYYQVIKSEAMKDLIHACPYIVYKIFYHNNGQPVKIGRDIFYEPVAAFCKYSLCKEILIFDRE